MVLRARRRVLIERLEARCLLSGTYIVNEVQDFALSQPLIYYYLKRGNTLLGTTSGGQFSFNDQAYLDTGTSGLIESQESSQALGIQQENYNGTSVVFEDIGIAGGSPFFVSEPLTAGLAAFNPNTNVDNTADYQTVYNQVFGPLRMEMNPTPTGDGFLTDPTNIMGMPTMMGKVVVMDPTPPYSSDPSKFGDMNTYIYNPGTPYNAAQASVNPGIPPTSLHVQLSYGDFSPYTTIDPAGAPGPQLSVNPIIGPNPLRAFMTNPPPDNTPPVDFGYTNNGVHYSANGSFLFDTGAQISFMSQAEAGKLHVHYKAGTYGKSTAQLVDDNGNPVPNQQVIPLSGLDGSTVYAAEFVMDSLTVQTQENTPIQFQGVPILVLDVGLTDPNTGKTLILDGDFGANMLETSMNNGTAAAFNWVTFDQPDGLLGFAPAGSISSATASLQGQSVFYNNSIYDGFDPAANSSDDNAIATDKQMLTAGHSPTYANFTSYVKGINGIMVDIANLAGTPTASDFNFLVGNSNNAADWTTAPAPTSTVTRPGYGVNGSTRIELTWADGTIKNEWLQVTVKADADTGLSTPDVFFIGNLVGAAQQGTLGTLYTVSSTDVTAAANDLHGFMNPAPITDTQDFNRDGRVDATDELIARNNSGTTLIMLNSSITGGAAPAAASATTPSSTTSGGQSIILATQLNSKDQRIADRLRKKRILLSLQRLMGDTKFLGNRQARHSVRKLLRQQIAAVKAVQPDAASPFAIPMRLL